MTNRTIDRGAAAIALAVLTIISGCQPADREAGYAGRSADVSRPTVTPADAHPSFLHGLVTTVEGVTYEGRLRFGGDQEAFWGDYFNGFKKGNPWAEDVDAERPWIRILGVEIGNRGPDVNLRRQLMARFGDIAKIEARDSDLWVTLRSGTEVHLDRYAADDFADGLRIWDASEGVVDLSEGRIRTIEFQPPDGSGAVAPHRLHGTVRTAQGEFTGFVQWDRTGSLGTDELEGRTADGAWVRLPFEGIESIARASPESSVVKTGGREIVLTGTRQVGEGNAGIYVDDLRYGRVLISWGAFERVDFSAAGAGPADGGPRYEDFPAGRPLTGTVTTRAGRGLAGRLVYDLDESEVTETLDAPSGGVDYTIPFGLVTSIALPAEGQSAGWATVILHTGEELELERLGDLGDGNAGILVFVDGVEEPEYVPWAEVDRIDFDVPRMMYPPIEGGP